MVKAKERFKNAYETLMTLVSDRICELWPSSSPQSSKGVLSPSAQGQTRKVAAGQPRSGRDTCKVKKTLSQYRFYF